ncbi:hypothetical protein DFH09DRAFT_1290476 [Mycena vulgaris]|nr:hypothetical protein DFH09DRAFT_1290476 [Mycena vulgaris]
MAPSTASSTLENVPTSTASGKFVMIARIECAPGKEARLEELISATRDIALSDAEPKTLTYRLSRSVDSTGTKGSTFVVFQEYEGLEGLKAHGANPAILALKKINETERITAGMTYEFFEEEFSDPRGRSTTSERPAFKLDMTWNRGTNSFQYERLDVHS